VRYVVGRGRVGSALVAALTDAVPVQGRGFAGIPELRAHDAVLLCVPDAALADVASVLIDSPAVVLHCAGAVPVSALGSGSKGVFYPMVSFRQNVSWRDVPVFAEANDGRTRAAIGDLVRDLGTPEPTWTDSATRASYHLGAVFANNFSNHLVALLQAYCRQAGLDSAAYSAMLTQTVEAAQRGEARSLQTGPAARGDQPTLERHLSMLPEELREVYRALSASIQRTTL